DRLRAQTAAGKPIVGAGAGTGISAKFAEAGGADFIVIYNSGRYRMAGHGSLAGVLAFGDANQIVKDMGEREVLPVVKEAPIIAHMGLTVGGSIGLEKGDAMRLEDAPAAVQAIGEAAWSVTKDALLLCHGGPIAEPDDAAYVLARCDAVGFVGASSMERLPVE